MRRVVITGLGAVSCLGNSREDITESLRLGRSGIVANDEFKEMGLRSQISGSVDIDITEHIDRKVRRFMGDSAAYAYIAMQQAIDDSLVDDRIRGKGEVRTMLLDGRDRQHRERFFRIDVLKLVRRQVLPVAALEHLPSSRRSG